ncbi:MAG TPA: hypothetical protein VG455_03210 [Acidimicrobiales bacterium]|nr:hypothetical protein [Acidimicrobiales bacterium]
MGAPLPSEAECGTRVRRSSWEPRPENRTANSTVAGRFSLDGYTTDQGYDVRSQPYVARVSGNFTGTTDEIIQWAACKWGFDDNIARAMAVTESTWYQGLVDASGSPVKDSGFGDYTTNPAACQAGYIVPCPQSFGLLQVKATSERGTFPWSRDSTAFNVDYTLMAWRLCYEGFTTWLRQYPGGTTPYAGGDAWGCIGFWYSGDWYGSDGGAQSYMNTVKGHLGTKPWLRWADRTPSDPNGTVVSVDDTAVGTGTNQVEYQGKWWRLDQEGAYHGTAHGSWENGDFYQLRFRGTAVALYATVRPDGGPARVSIDGGPETPVSFYASARAVQQLIYASPVLSAGDHTLKVRNAGSGTVVIADRADVTNVSAGGTGTDGYPSTTVAAPPQGTVLTIDERVVGTALNQFEYRGSWWTLAQTGAHLGYTRGSWGAGDFYQVRFEGSRVAVYGTVRPDGGTAGVSIDGGHETAVTFHAATRAAQQLIYLSPPLATGVHTLKVRNSGPGTLIVADRVDVS